jgi:DNA-binding beta-propeller fold protein YncE
MKYGILLMTITSLTFFSCKKEKIDEPIPATSFTADANGIYICNEGTFTGGNSTITYTTGTESETIHDVYKIANNENLGDVGQSMTKIGNKIYIVVNNSSKVEVVDEITLKKSATISGFNSPRFLIEARPGKAYVTDLYANGISIVDLTSNTITGTINLNGSTEDLILHNGKVYVTNLSTSYLYIIEPNTDVVEDSVLIGPGGNSLQLDANNKLWILCGGDFITGAAGSLHRVDPSSKSVELSLTFPAGNYPTRLTINETNNEIYFLDMNVYKMQLSDLTLPSSPLIDAAGKSFYGMAFDEVNRVLYVTDAIDYQQAGRIYRYDPTGTLLNSLPAGIIPGEVLFLNN